MAFITLQQMYDAWKRVQDWVSGASADKPRVTIDNFPATQNVQLTGSNMEYYGATVAQRPAANSVPVGAYFMAVQTQEIWQSDGTDWVEV